MFRPSRKISWHCPCKKNLQNYDYQISPLHNVKEPKYRTFGDLGLGEGQVETWGEVATVPRAGRNCLGPYLLSDWLRRFKYVCYWLAQIWGILGTYICKHLPFTCGSALPSCCWETSIEHLLSYQAETCDIIKKSELLRSPKFHVICNMILSLCSTVFLADLLSSFIDLQLSVFCFCYLDLLLSSICSNL